MTIDGQKYKLPVTEEMVKREFADVFSGVGELPGGEYHLRLKQNCRPVQHPPRRVANKQKERYLAKLKEMVAKGIITLVKKFTEWVNSIVTVEKPDGSLRICLDPSDLNKALERDQYHMKTLDEISSELHDTTLFTLVDAAHRFWHIKLDKESSFLTTFKTPWGKYRFLRLPFGLKVSGDVF